MHRNLNNFYASCRRQIIPLCGIIFILFLCQNLLAKNSIQVSVSAKSVVAGEDATITIYTLDDKGIVSRGIRVSLSVIMGGGKVSPKEDISDGSGTIRATLTTGKSPGMNAVKIESPGITPAYAYVEGTVLPPSEFSLKVEPNKIYTGQSAILTVTVKNSKGEPTKDVLVTFIPGDLISIVPKSAKTDGQGIAKATVTALKQTGITKVEVKVGNLESQSVDFEVLAPQAKDILASVSPASINTKSKSTVKVKILDTVGAPVSSVKINFEIAEGDGTLSTNQAATDSKGECSVILTSGTTAGSIVVKISAKDFNPVEVKINVSSVTLSPAKLTASSGYDSSLIAGDDATITATVTDKEDRLVTGAKVYFEVLKGGGNLISNSEVTESGKASVILTTGTKPGKNVIKVICGNLKPVEISIVTQGERVYKPEKAGEASKVLGYVYPKNLIVGQSSNIRTIVTDKNNLPVSKAKVTFKIVRGEGNLSSHEEVTDTNGEAQVKLTSSKKGTVEVKIELPLVETAAVVVVYSYPTWYLIILVLLLFGLLILIYGFKRSKIKKKVTNLLTKLPSDLFIKYKVKDYINNKKKFSAIFIDLDDFKFFNIAYGFKKGDSVIESMAELIKSVCSSSDIIGHLGGDDFVILTNPKKSESLSKKILNGFNDKVKYFYEETDRINGYITIKNEDGTMFNYPLMTVSIAVVDSDKFTPRNYNEFCNIAEKIMKSAKAKKGNTAVDSIDDDAERGTKQYKIGWFTIGIVLLGLIFNKCTYGADDVDITKILSGFARPEVVGAGQKSEITAHLSDNKDRPISNAYVLFKVEEGGGALEKGWAISDKNGNCKTILITGRARGKNVVKMYCGRAVPAKVEVSGNINILGIWHYFIIIVLLGASFILIKKLLNIRSLLKGIDKDVGLRTRPSAERKINGLITTGTKFSCMFIEYRNFWEFNREYGYEQGEKAIKAISDITKSAVKEFKDKQGEVFYYGGDRFVVITLNDTDLIAKNLLEEIEIHIPLLCEDKNANYYLLHLSVGIVTCDVGRVKNIGEIMQSAGKLIRDLKDKPGSSYANSKSNSKSGID